jgi:hypothetical protein
MFNFLPALLFFSSAPLPVTSHTAIDRTNHIIKFEGNHPEIHLAGLNDDEGDRARGLKLWRANLDEIQDIKPSVLNRVISSATAEYRAVGGCSREPQRDRPTAHCNK